VRSSTIIMIAVAAVFGLLAVFVAQSWLNSQAEARLRSLEAQKAQPVSAQTIVVASRQLRFGNELSASVLREMPWPADAVPQGASKITGLGQRATLSATIGEGHKAVTIRVNDVDGVAGFVLPGDRVDVMLSRQLEKNSAINDVVLKNTRVLAVDQLADERSDKPSVAKAVTLEVDLAGAQKLSLASQVGTLSLALRKAGDQDSTASRPITLADLMNSRSSDEPDDHGKFATISVTRAMNKTIYSVLKDGGSRATVLLGQEPAR
jgi:pilus assembly protein CpaB